MGQAVRAEASTPPEQATERLMHVAAFAHAHPQVSERMAALMETHRAHRVEAAVALDEALALLRSLGADPSAWCDEHPGRCALWPCRETLELRERVRVIRAA